MPNGYEHTCDANQYYRPKAEASLGNVITRIYIAGFITRAVSRSGVSSPDYCSSSVNTSLRPAGSLTRGAIKADRIRKVQSDRRQFVLSANCTLRSPHAETSYRIVGLKRGGRGTHYRLAAETIADTR